MWYALTEKVDGKSKCYCKTILDIDSDDDCKNCIRQICWCYTGDFENVSGKDDILQDLALIAIEKHADPELIYDPFKDLEASKQLLKLIADTLSSSPQNRKHGKQLVRVDFEAVEKSVPAEDNFDIQEIEEEDEKSIDFRKIKTYATKLTRGKQRRILETYLSLRAKYPKDKITYKQITSTCKRLYHFAPSPAQISMAIKRIAEKIEKNPYLIREEEIAV